MDESDSLPESSSLSVEDDSPDELSTAAAAVGAVPTAFISDWTGPVVAPASVSIWGAASSLDVTSSTGPSSSSACSCSSGSVSNTTLRVASPGAGGDMTGGGFWSWPPSPLLDCAASF